MRQIPLTQDQVAFVDDEDYETLTRHRWRAQYNSGAGSFYAGRNTSKDKKKLYMHRVIMNAPLGVQVDHINGNTLDNRRANLRFASKSENGRNRGKQANNKSGYKGVSWGRRESKWYAYIQLNSKTKCLGYFDSILDAARAYDAAAIELHGAFAKLNFPQEASNT